MNKSTLQALVDSYEDIPALMSRIRDGNASKTTRFHPAMVPNQSVQAEKALRGYEKVDSRTADVARVSRMALQAKKVLSHIASLPTNSAANPANQLKKSKSVSENAQIAMEKLETLQRNGVDLKRFYAQYDVQKTGKVSYKDFTDTLMHLCSGVNKTELYAVASAVDQQKTGSVSYDNLVNALKNVRDSSKYQNPPFSNSPHTVSKKLQKPPAINPKAVVDVTPLEAVLQPNLAPMYNYETAQEACERLRFAETLAQEAQHRRNFHASVPFHVDATGDALRQARKNETAALDSAEKNERKKLKRSQSAPPRAERSSFYREHFRHDNLPVPDVWSSVGNEEVTDKEVQRTLKDVLNETRERTYLSKLGLAEDTPVEDTAATHATHLCSLTEKMAQKEQNNANFNDVDEENLSPLARETQLRHSVLQSQQHRAKTTVFNRLISETAGVLPVLRHALTSQDVSRSGRVSREELRHALSRAGVSLSDEEHHALCTFFTAEHSDNYTDNLHNKGTSLEDELRPFRPINRSLSSSNVQSLIANERDTQDTTSLNTTLKIGSRFNFEHRPLSRNDTIDIDRFIDTVTQRASAPALRHLVTQRDTPVTNNVETAETQATGRVAQKVLDAFQKHVKPLQLLRDTAATQVATSTVRDTPVTWSQLTDMLKFSHAALSDRELSLLKRSLPFDTQYTNKDTPNKKSSAQTWPSVSWGEIESSLRHTCVATQSQASRDTSVQHYLSAHPHARYSQTFRSSVSFGRDTGEDTALPRATSSDKRDVSWAKLQHMFATQPQKLADVFLNPRFTRQQDSKNETDNNNNNINNNENNKNNNNNNNNNNITTTNNSRSNKTLKQRLKDVGFILSPEDFQRVECQLSRRQNRVDNNNVTCPLSLDSRDTGVTALEDFCEAFQFPVRHLANATRHVDDNARSETLGVSINVKPFYRSVEVVDPLSKEEPEGMFASSRHSVLASNTFATTLAVSPHRWERLQHKLLPVTKRRAQSAGRFNSLSDYLSAKDQQPAENFWDMKRSCDNVMLFPTLPNSASSYPRHPDFLNTSSSQTSLNLGKSRQGVVSLKEYRHPVNNGGEENVKRPDSRLSCSSTNTNNTSVASTVVPRHTKRQNSAQNLGRNMHIVVNDHETAPASAVSTPNYNALTPYNNSFNANNALSKWASASLAAYHEERDRVFGGAIANFNNQQKEGGGAFQHHHSRASSPANSHASSVSSSAVSQQSRGRRLLKEPTDNVNGSNSNSSINKSGFNNSKNMNDIFKTPEPTVSQRTRRAQSLPPYATHEGY